MFRTPQPNYLKVGEGFIERHRTKTDEQAIVKAIIEERIISLAYLQTCLTLENKESLPRTLKKLKEDGSISIEGKFPYTLIKDQSGFP